MSKHRFSNKTHPITTEYARKFIADNSFLRLVFYYLVLIAFLSLLLSLIPHCLLKDTGYLNSVIYTSFGLLGESVGTINADLSSWFYFYRIALKFLSILLPTAFLGLIVYKLFIIPDIFVFRKHISLFEKEEGKQNLAIRFYNGTNLDLSPVEIKIFARVSMLRESGERFLKNFEIYSNTWPISLPKVPFTINLPVHEFDSELGEYKVSWNGTEVKLTKETKLLILINGSVSELDKSFSEKHLVSLDDISFSKFSDVDVDYETSPKDWRGWQNFDN